MAIVYADLIEETTSSGGEDAFTLAGATSGHRAWSVIGNGNEGYYFARGSTFTEWEIGRGTWSTGGTLTRSVVYKSSNSDSLVDFTGTGITVRNILPAVIINTLVKDNDSLADGLTFPNASGLKIANSDGDHTLGIVIGGGTFSANRTLTLIPGDANRTLTLSGDTTLSGTNTGDQTLPTRDSLGLDTDDSPQFAGIELGHASDTTIARSAAGKVAVEGKAVPLMSGAHNLVIAGPTAARTWTGPDADATLVVAGAATGSGLTMATSRLLGRTTASTGAIEEITVSGLTLSGGALTASDATINTSDITTNDVSTTKHGFAPKAPNDTAKFLRGDGTWAAPSRKLVQRVSTTTNGTFSTNTQIPLDDTIPQSSEGAEVITLSITPTSASNKLRITFSTYGGTSGAGTPTIALFRDSAADALEARSLGTTAGSVLIQAHCIFEVTPAGTSSETYKIRAGPNGAFTLYLNRGPAAEYFSTASNLLLEIEEIAP